MVCGVHPAMIAFIGATGQNHAASPSVVATAAARVQPAAGRRRRTSANSHQLVPTAPSSIAALTGQPKAM
jgi:hypothetical protein